MRIIDSYREIKKNPRLHGLVRLVLWLIPITIVVIILRNSPKSSYIDNPKQEKNDYMKNLETIKVFKFKYDVGDISYDGKYLNGVISLENSSNNYMIKDNTMYYEKSDHELEDIKYLYPSYLYNFIKNNELYSETSFKDGSIAYCYNSDDTFITIKVKDNYIINTIIEYNDTKYNIDYYDINLEDFSISEDIYVNILNEDSNENKDDNKENGEEND